MFLKQRTLFLFLEAKQFAILKIRSTKNLLIDLNELNSAQNPKTEIFLPAFLRFYEHYK